MNDKYDWALACFLNNPQSGQIWLKIWVNNPPSFEWHCAIVENNPSK